MRNSACFVLQAIILMMCVLSLSGCGYHLRGTKNPVSTTRNIALTIVADKNKLRPDFLRSLNREFAHLRAPVADESQTLSVVTKDNKAKKLFLQIIDFRYDKRVLTVDDKGRVNEYELIQTLTYQLYQEDSSKTRDHIIRTQRLMGFDRKQLLIKEREEAFLVQEMYQDLWRQLRNHMRHVG